MGPRKPIGKPPSEEGKEVAAGLVRAGVSMIPLVGGPTVELIDLVLQPAIHRRRDAWLEDLASAVDELREHAVDVRTLADNELVVTVILNATAAAARTHEAGKREALRNVVVNSALAIGLDEHVQLMFLRFVDEFTALHLQVLAYLRSPLEWYNSHGLPTRETMTGARSMLLEVAFPELKGRQVFYRQLLNELGARGLCSPEMLSGMVSSHAMWDPSTTDLGNQFLTFIARP